MGKEIINDAIILGYKSKHCPKASTFEIEVAKLLTACSLMPSMNVQFEFEKFDNELRLNFQPANASNHNVSEMTIELDQNRIRAFQLCSVINNIRTNMALNHTLSKDDCISKSDDILMTALLDAANTIKNNPEARQELIDRVSAISLKTNTLRKMLNAENGEMSTYESLLTTVLTFIDYFTNSNHPNNELSRLNVNNVSYYRYLDNLECVNRAIREKCIVGHNISFNDQLSARNPNAEKKACYLSGLHQKTFHINSLFNTRSIITSKANILDDSQITAEEMLDD